MVLRLEEGLLERVDRARGDVPRQRWLVRVIEAALESTSGHQDRSAAPAVQSDQPLPVVPLPKIARRRQF